MPPFSASATTRQTTSSTRSCDGCAMWKVDTSRSVSSQCFARISLTSRLWPSGSLRWHFHAQLSFPMAALAFSPLDLQLILQVLSLITLFVFPFCLTMAPEPPFLSLSRFSTSTLCCICSSCSTDLTGRVSATRFKQDEACKELEGLRLNNWQTRIWKWPWQREWACSKASLCLKCNVM